MKLNDSEHSSIWAQFSNPDTGLGSGKSISSIRAIVLAAHPDDETIGASAVLQRMPDVTVAFLTDGAPRDTRLWSGGVSGSREDYGRRRFEEAVSALSIAGIPAEHILSLGGVDQEATCTIPELTTKLAQLMTANRPQILITHAYEGGHPDHDAASLIASLAVERYATCVELVEMTSYHLREGRCVTGEFLTPNHGFGSHPELLVPLSSEASDRKQRMMSCYYSQRLVLQDFPISAERFRLAPRYDFALPPHPGKLWYECLEWPLTGRQWRELAAAAMTTSGVRG